MDLTDQKANGINFLTITDSLNAPCLAMKLTNNNTTIIPTTNDLIIYISEDELDITNAKQVVFTLNHPLLYLENIRDEFILEPQIKQFVMNMT